MKSPGLWEFFLFCIALFYGITFSVSSQVVEYPYEQHFESPFTTGEEVEFLPFWWANDVSSGASRIHQAGATEARSGEAALGVVPTGSYKGEIRLLFDAGNLEGGEISFWARSAKNGSGSRSSVITYSFSADGGKTFTEAVSIAEDLTFPNADTEYQQFSFPFPESLWGHSDAVLRLLVQRGPEGEGTAAKVLIDDFLFSNQPAAFRLQSAVAINQNQIELLFNKSLDNNAAELKENYQLNQAAEVREATLDNSNERRVLLTTSTLQADITYTLGLGKILDVEGNSAEGQEVQFALAAADRADLAIYDLLISEIHAAPNENTLLPNVEWVEIYNASGRTLQLEGIQLADEGRTASLPSYSLEAGNYLVLTAKADVGELEKYGAVVGLSLWPSLNNDGDILSLYSKENNLIDRVAYSQGWYQSGLKSKGGWSMERIDLNNPCVGETNWIASTATAGGTPAQLNSVATDKPDGRGPYLQLAFVLDPLTIQLVFNEALDTTQLASARLELNPSLPILKLEPVSDVPERLLLKLSAPLSMEHPYYLSISNLRDCSGNLMESVVSAAVAYPVQAKAQEVVLNEVMFDPSPNSEEWIEIANATDQFLDLQNWQLASWSNGIKSTAILSREQLILPPAGILVFSRQVAGVTVAFPSAPEGQLLQIPFLPVLANSGDTLALIDAAGKVIDKFRYYQDLHSSFAKETKGVSLERISLAAPTNTKTNWTSAAGTANYGTPGLPNSQRFQGIEGLVDELVIEPAVIIPGSQPPTSFATIQFKASQLGLQATLRIFDMEGREIRTLAHNQLIGAESLFTWDGTTESQNKVRMGYYIVLLHVFGENGYNRKFRRTVVVGN